MARTTTHPDRIEPKHTIDQDVDSTNEKLLVNTPNNALHYWYISTNTPFYWIHSNQYTQRLQDE